MTESTFAINCFNLLGGSMKYLTLMALAALSFYSNANTNLPDNRHISIVGTAQLEAKPDIAVVYLEVESIKSQSADAKKEVDNRVNNLLDGLVKFKVDEANVSASNITTDAHYSYLKNGQREVNGYIAKRTLKVTLNKIKYLNAFMDFALSVKIDKIRNVEFKSSKEKSLKDEVNALAVSNAKAQGHSLASAFNAKLGKVYSINSSSNQSRNRYGANYDVEHIAVSGVAMSTPPPRAGKYLQENIVYSASINIVFDLEVK